MIYIKLAHSCLLRCLHAVSGEATECKMVFRELLLRFSQQMAMKGTSAGTSADLFLMVLVCLCVCVFVHMCTCILMRLFFFLVHLRHLPEMAA